MPQKSLSYIHQLKKKHRNYLKKIFKDKAEKKITVDFVKDFLPLLDEVLYPLYSKVNKNAKEYQTALLPKSFFHDIKKTWGDNSFILVIKDEAKNYFSICITIKRKRGFESILDRNGLFKTGT